MSKAKTFQNSEFMLWLWMRTMLWCWFLIYTWLQFVIQPSSSFFMRIMQKSHQVINCKLETIKVNLIMFMCSLGVECSSMGARIDSIYIYVHNWNLVNIGWKLTRVIILIELVHETKTQSCNVITSQQLPS